MDGVEETGLAAIAPLHDVLRDARQVDTWLAWHACTCSGWDSERGVAPAVWLSVISAIHCRKVHSDPGYARPSMFYPSRSLGERLACSLSSIFPSCESSDTVHRIGAGGADVLDGMLGVEMVHRIEL